MIEQNTSPKQGKINNLNIFEPGSIIFITGILIGLVELITGLFIYKSGMNIPQFVSAISLQNRMVTFFMYMVILIGTFPLVLLLFNKYGVSLKAELIPDKRKILNYVIFGAIAGIITFAIRFSIMNILAGMPLERNHDNLGLNVLYIISLVFVSGFFKEVTFRGIPRIFLKNHMGEWTAFLIGNICFAIVDWPNLGISFIFGAIWYLFYRSQKSLLVPIIAHGLHNLLALLATTGVLAFVGIIPL